MKWLKSTTQKAWVASVGDRQIIIPQNETADHRWLSLEDAEYAEVSALPVIASLIKANGIMVLDQEPAELKNSIPVLQVTNNQLKADLEVAKGRIAELENQLKDASGVDIEAIKAEAVETVQKQLDELQSKYSELEAEAKQALAEKDAKIEKLEKKLKKAGEE